MYNIIYSYKQYIGIYIYININDASKCHVILYIKNNIISTNNNNYNRENTCLYNCITYFNILTTSTTSVTLHILTTLTSLGTFGTYLLIQY